MAEIKKQPSQATSELVRASLNAEEIPLAGVVGVALVADPDGEATSAVAKASIRRVIATVRRVITTTMVPAVGRAVVECVMFQGVVETLMPIPGHRKSVCIPMILVAVERTVFQPIVKSSVGPVASHPWSREQGQAAECCKS